MAFMADPYLLTPKTTGHLPLWKSVDRPPTLALEQPHTPRDSRAMRSTNEAHGAGTQGSFVKIPLPGKLLLEPSREILERAVHDLLPSWPPLPAGALPRRLTSAAGTNTTLRTGLGVNTSGSDPASRPTSGLPKPFFLIEVLIRSLLKSENWSQAALTAGPRRAMHGSPCKFRLSFCGSSEKSPLAITLMAGASAGLAGGTNAGLLSW